MVAVTADPGALQLAAGAGQEAPAEAALQDDAYARMRAENLISFIVVSSRKIDADVAQVKALAEFVRGRFAYYEILIVGAAPSAAWMDELHQVGTQVENLRIIALDVFRGYEDLAFSSLNYAIGDHVVSLFPGEIQAAELDGVLQTLASGQFGIVKVRHRGGAGSVAEALTAKLTGRLIKFSTGQEIEAYQARVFAITRASLSRIQTMGERLKHFRIINVSNQIAQGHFDLERTPKRRFLSAFGDKLRLAADLVSLSSSRLLRSLALVCFILSLASLAATLLSFLLWLFLTDIVSGWTSLAMLFSSLFAANFGVLGALCLGILQLIRQAAPDETDVFSQEISGGDLIFRDDQLNVETDEGHAK